MAFENPTDPDGWGTLMGRAHRAGDRRTVLAIAESLGTPGWHSVFKCLECGLVKYGVGMLPHPGTGLPAPFAACIAADCEGG